jgi:hypothetical protein
MNIIDIVCEKLQKSPTTVVFIQKLMIIQPTPIVLYFTSTVKWSLLEFHALAMGVLSPPLLAPAPVCFSSCFDANNLSSLFDHASAASASKGSVLQGDSSSYPCL